MRIVLMGPPGAGKGSLAELLKSMMPIAHVSTGDMLREEMAKGTPLGLEIKALVDKGALVSDELVTRLVEDRMKNDPSMAGNYMLDGFPRTVKQAQDLDAILARTGKKLDFVLDMEASMDVILVRLTGRRLCKKCGAIYHLKNKPPRKEGLCDSCGGPLYQRSDDNEETIRKRMDVYKKSTAPIIEYYRESGRLKEIHADKSTEAVRTELLEILDEDKKQHQAQKSS